MKRVLFYIAAALMAVFTFTSCVEDEYGYPPVYGKVYCVNENPVARVTMPKNRSSGSRAQQMREPE